MSLLKWNAVRGAGLFTLSTTLFIATVSGCNASASFSTSSKEAKSPAPPPPPPPPPPVKAEKPEKQDDPAKAEEEPSVVTKGDSILLPGNIVFDSGKASLKAGENNDAILEQLTAYLGKHEKVTLTRIEGHTDNVGEPADNLKLSGERALTIKNALIERGVSADRLLAVGFGEAKPIADNANEAGRAQNRRTEFKIAAVNGRDYLGNNPDGGGTEFK